MTQPEASPPSQASARELGLRIQAGFSAGEVRRLLETWGATPEELEGDATTLAHRLVSIGIKRFGPSEMTRRLKAEKPLIEWPEEDPGSDKWAGPAPGLDLSPPPDAPLEAAPTLVDTPAVAEERSEPPPPEPEKPAPPPASSNPMIVFEPEAGAERAGGNVRYLIAGGAGLLALTALAFGAGLAWNRNSPEEAGAASAEPGASASILAQRAVTKLDDGLLAVASLCDLEVSGRPSRDVLSVAQEGCGQDKGSGQKRRSLRPELDDEPAKRPDDRDEPARSRPASVAEEPAPRQPREDPPPRDQPAGRGTCTKSCMRVQDECVAECGPEPKNASLYDGFLACTGKCITASSRCRTSCP